MTNEVFLDTGYAIALSNEFDEHHQRALELFGTLDDEKIKLVTTQAILLEIGNALSKLRFRKAAVELLETIAEDPQVEIVPLTDRLYQEALGLFKERPDKEWGIVDCVSFIVMSRRGMTDALSADADFAQAGFRPLLRKKE